MTNDDDEIGTLLAGLGPPPLDEGEEGTDAAPDDEAAEAASRECTRDMMSALKTNDVHGFAKALGTFIDLRK